MKLSIVTTMYKSAPYLEELYTRLCRSAGHITEDYEIIFVNDGSPDHSLELALQFGASDNRVRVIDLSRNFGHHKAIMTGLSHARGDLVFLIDSDLEEDPELLEHFYDRYTQSSVDVVFGVQERRKGGLFEKLSGDFFYGFFNWLSDVPIPRNILTVRLMSRRYIQKLLEYREREVFLAGLMQLAGFAQLPLVVQKHHKGSSTYSFSRKVNLLVNAITSFSNKPLIFIFHVGVVITTLSLFYAAYILIKKIIWGIGVPGWATTVISVSFLSGVIILCQGIIGIYLAKVYMEAKQRPYTTVRTIYEYRAPLQKFAERGVKSNKVSSNQSEEQ